MIKLKDILNEETQKNYNRFPLNVLVAHAKKFNDYQSFEKFFSVDIGHGYYWHITDSSDFKPSSDYSPRDMSSMGSGEGGTKGLMITSDVENWLDNYKKTGRGFAALLDLSQVDPKFLKQVSRGFGNEIFLPQNEVGKVKVIKTYSITSVKRKERELENIVPHSSDELKNLWDFAHQK
jgi:hypothetical protein